VTADFTVAAAVPADFLALGFAAADFRLVPVFDFVSLVLGCFAANFRAVVLVGVGFRADDRDDAAFWVVPFAAGRFVPEPPDRAVFGLASWATFGRETFTRPRMARPADRPFAAAFAVARRVDLLCGVEAMGTTLVTVVTW